MLTKIAWKNIWRNKVRSAILITAIALGIWALIFLNGLTVGMVNGYVESAINNRTSHLQIHTPEYDKEKEISHFFNDQKLQSYLNEVDFITDFSSRIVVDGMISSAHSSKGVILYGIDESAENNVTGLDDKIVSGNPLGSEFTNAILISASLADKLGVKVRSKVVINFQNRHGEVTAAAFRIAGLIRNVSGKADEMKAYTRREDLQKLAGLNSNEVHEVAILTVGIDQVNKYQNKIKKQFPDLAVKNYKEIAPDLALMSTQIQLSLSIMIVIFMLALIFGIINTMLMAVLERYKELGMLIAVGMKKMQVFVMVVLETIFLSFIGVPFGMLLGAVSLFLTHKNGINLERWAEGLNQFGMMTMIYPELSFRYYLIIALAVLVTAVLASIYPARKATSLNPIQALRKI